jgi:hypothetical protein
LEKENQNRLISKLLKAKQEQGEQSESGPLFKLSQVATSENLKRKGVPAITMKKPLIPKNSIVPN